MKKIMLVIIFSFVSFFSGIFINTVPVNAEQENNLLCQIFPFIKGIVFAESLCTGKPDGDGALSTTQSLVQFGASLIFIGIIAVAIFIIIKAAIKYIRSEGDEGQVEEATKAIKNVFIGIAALLVGIIGLVIILSIFSSTTASNEDGLLQNPDRSLISPT